MKSVLRIACFAVCFLTSVFTWAEDSWYNIMVGGQTNTVYTMFRDNRGLMWFGTNNGVFTYDGHLTRKVGIASNIGIRDAHYHCIVQYDNRLYLGSDNGLMTYDLDEHTLSRLDGDLPLEIRALLLVDNQLWIGSLYGLYVYSIESGAVRRVADLPHEAVYSLLHASNGMIFVGTYNGLVRYDPQTNRGTIIDLEAQVKGRNIFVNTLAEDPVHRCILVGTEGLLLKYSMVDNTMQCDDGMNGNSIKSLVVSTAGEVFVGTDNGLITVDATGCRTVSRHNSSNGNSIANNVIWTVSLDSDNRLWAGTDYGVSIMDKTNDIVPIPLDQLTGRNDGNQVTTILRDSRGILWFGGTNGLIKCEWPLKSNTTWFMPGNPNAPLSHNRVRQIAETHNGDIWVATDGGVNSYNAASKQFINYHITDSTGLLNTNWAYGICHDNAGSLWIASYMGGVMQVDYDKIMRNNGNYVADKTYCSRNTLPNNLAGAISCATNGDKWVLLFRDNNIIRIDGNDGHTQQYDIHAITGGYPLSILNDSVGALWCAVNGGLLRIAADGETVNEVQLGQGGNETMLTMAQVGKQLWVSSTSGIWAVDTLSMKSRHIPVIKDNVTSIYYDQLTHRVLLGCVDKVLSVSPSISHKSTYNPTVNIMGIYIDDSLIAPGDIVMLTEELRTGGTYNRIVIELTALNYDPNKNLRYAYRIDNSDEWTCMAEGYNSITISNLAQGHHDIEVKVVDSEAESRHIAIYVPGPWYTSQMAFVVYIIISLLIISAIYIYVRHRIRRRNEEIDRQRTIHAVQSKLDFLSNMSHELKTPLSMIVGPASKLLEDTTDPNQQRVIRIIYDNALKLNTMVHKAVEINRLEQNQEVMIINSHINIVDFCRNVFDSYQDSHQDKHFIFTASDPSIMVDIDVVKLESVLNNLLSNACKYSGNDSTISCSVNTLDEELTIMVSDDGIGIPEEEQKLIFQRLFRSGRSAEIREGTGIGLYLVKQYVEMMNGSIEVYSRENEGSTFIVKFPVTIAQLQPSTEASSTAQTSKAPKVLIVEDNTNISEFIAEVLNPQYQCINAVNGRAGLSVAATYHPDLIITDEMMPVMTGIEMCRRIKEIPYLAHVPIIMLTAKDDNDTETESVRTGIDVFMPKPFNATILRERVSQLIQQRIKSRQQARIETMTQSTPTEPSESIYEKQLSVVTETIEKHLSDPQLNVGRLCQLTDMQQQQLYRLTKRFVGITPVEFIRQIRIKRAAILLAERKFTVSEVAYMVGFSNPSYFSKCFMQVYGCQPSQYTGT